MDFWPVIESAIRARRDQLVAGDLMTDEGIDKTVKLVHPLLPIAVRLALKKDKLAIFIKNNRDKIVPLL